MRTSRDEIQTSMTQIEIGSATHVGRVRSNNEDSYRVVPTLNLLVLSDGIGGQANGEVASAMAVETMVTHCLEFSTSGSTHNGNEPESKVSEKTKALVSAANLAN